MNVLRKFDGFLLDRAERFSHFMQRTFGTRANDLNRFCLVVAAGAMLAITVDGALTAKSWLGRTVGVFANALVVGLLFQKFIDSFELDEFHAILLSRGFSNPTKAWWHLRLSLFVIADLMTSLGVLYGICWGAQLVAFYFQSCDDLPPGESRVRKFLNSLRPTPAPAQEVG